MMFGLIRQSLERILFTIRIAFVRTLSLSLLGFVCGCESGRSQVTSAFARHHRRSMMSAEEIVVKRLWDRTDQTIARMGRPSRLHKVVPSKTVLVVVDMQNGFCLP